MSRGFLYMGFAVCLLAFQQVIVKLLPGVSVYQIVFFRALISLLICVAVMSKQKRSFKGENYPLLLCRGIIGTLSLLTFFYTIHHIPLATAVTIGHLSPIFLGILAMIFLKEKVSPIFWIAIMVSFAGVLVIKGFDVRITGLELLIALSSAILAGLAHFTVRLLKDENPLTVLYYFSLVMVLVLFPFLLYYWTLPNQEEWILLLLMGVISHFAQLFLTKALKEEEVSIVGGVYYLGIILSVVAGFMFFGEDFNLETIIGMTLIVIGFVLDRLFGLFKYLREFWRGSNFNSTFWRNIII